MKKLWYSYKKKVCNIRIYTFHLNLEDLTAIAKINKNMVPKVRIRKFFL